MDVATIACKCGREQGIGVGIDSVAEDEVCVLRGAKKEGIVGKGISGKGAYSFWDGILEVFHCVFHPEPCLALAPVASWS